MSYTLRLCEDKDRDSVLRICSDFQQASPYKSIVFDEIKVGSLILRSIEGDKTELITILLIDGIGEVCGVIVGHVFTLPFSDTKCAGEIIWWVDPEHRNKRGSLMLFEAFEFWGKKVGAEFLQVTNTRGTTDLQKFYERKGYSEAEITYYKSTQSAAQVKDLQDASL